MAIPKFKPVADLSQGTKDKLKPLFGVILALLIGAFGLEATKTDFDLGKLMQGQTLQEAKVPRDSNGNLILNPKVKRDSSGNFLLENCTKDLYNCENFKTQSEAQEVYLKCGGKGDDVNNLDRDKDGKPCEDLPVGK